MQGARTANAQPRHNYYVMIGSYSPADQAGIHVFDFNAANGAMKRLHGVAGLVNPSFLAVDPSHRFLYAVNETADFNQQKTGAVTAFSIDQSTGSPAKLNTRSSQGAGPCHVTVDKSGRWVMVANYSGGNAAVFPIMDDGSLGDASCVVNHEGSSVHPKRQTKPYAHSINMSPDNRFAFVADLGIDKIMIYRFDAAAGKLSANDPPFVKTNPGAGPRHFTFHPSGKFAFVIEELSSTITSFRYRQEQGALDPLQTISTLPADFQGQNTCADIHCSPDGAFVYGSNRGHDSIAIFSIDETSGRLTNVGFESTRGLTPRNFAIDPTGSYLLAANQNTDNLVQFTRDPQSGKLTPTGVVFEMPKPVCVQFVPKT